MGCLQAELKNDIVKGEERAEAARKMEREALEQELSILRVDIANKAVVGKVGALGQVINIL